MTTPLIRYSTLQARAVDQTKKGGDLRAAQVYATLTLAEAVRNVDVNDIARAIDGLGTSVETAAL